MLAPREIALPKTTRERTCQDMLGAGHPFVIPV
jgi:hypothetical protein